MSVWRVGSRLLLFWAAVCSASAVEVGGGRAGGRRRWVQSAARPRRAWLLAATRLRLWQFDLASHSGMDSGDPFGPVQRAVLR